MKNKLFISALALTVLTPVLVQPIQAEAAVKDPFKDISKDSPYYSIIHEMRDQNIISGYEDGTFKPNEVISRKNAVALITRAVKGLPNTTAFRQPKDLSTANSYYGDIKKLMEAGLLQLDAKGNINPNAPLTRGEMAKILATAYELDTRGSTRLKDVSSTYSKYVTALYNSDVTTGFEDKTFRENEALTRAHYAVFMYRAENYKKTAIDIHNLTDLEIEALTNEQVKDMLVTLKFAHRYDLELPKGYTDKHALSQKLSKEYNVYFKENGLDRNITNGITGIVGPTKDKQFKNDANNIQKPFGEFIDMINQAYLTGELIKNDENDPVKFALYFNYVEGHFVFGYRSY